jgi:glycerophosphoryl diester phosphodiesterase
MQSPIPSPLILGHRGSPLKAPENTLRSFVLAREEGADGIETDVHLARDGVPVVIHDATIDRTMPAHGPVHTMDWPALQRLSRSQLPSLEQAAAWAAGTGAWMNVEIKATGAERNTLEVLQRTGGLDRIIISSFDPRTVAEVGRLAPEVRRFLLLELWDAPSITALAESGAQGVCLCVDAATPANLAAIRARAMPVIVWTVDERDRMVELLRAGVDGLITNRPALAASARTEVSG